MCGYWTFVLGLAITEAAEVDQVRYERLAA